MPLEQFSLVAEENQFITLDLLESLLPTEAEILCYQTHKTMYLVFSFKENRWLIYLEDKTSKSDKGQNITTYVLQNPLPSEKAGIFTIDSVTDGIAHFFILKLEPASETIVKPWFGRVKKENIRPDHIEMFEKRRKEYENSVYFQMYLPWIVAVSTTTILFFIGNWFFNLNKNSNNLSINTHVINLLQEYSKENIFLNGLKNPKRYDLKAFLNYKPSFEQNDNFSTLFAEYLYKLLDPKTLRIYREKYGTSKPEFKGMAAIYYPPVPLTPKLESDLETGQVLEHEIREQLYFDLHVSIQGNDVNFNNVNLVITIKLLDKFDVLNIDSFASNLEDISAWIAEKNIYVILDDFYSKLNAHNKSALLRKLGLENKPSEKISHLIETKLDSLTDSEKIVFAQDIGNYFCVAISSQSYGKVEPHDSIMEIYHGIK